MAKNVAKLTAKVPLPSAFRPLTESKPADDRPPFCNDTSHKTVEDCVAAARARTEPVNGVQMCSLVAAKNGILSFRALMQWDAWIETTPPPGRLTARVIWERFERLMNGCTDHIVNHIDLEDIEQLLGVYVDYADPLRSSTALAFRMVMNGVATPELVLQLKRQLQMDPLLLVIFDIVSKRTQTQEAV